MSREQLIQKVRQVLFRATPEQAPRWIVDALLPQVTTPEELLALPDLTLLVDVHGDAVRWRASLVSGFDAERAPGFLRVHGPLTVVWRPPASCLESVEAGSSTR